MALIECSASSLDRNSLFVKASPHSKILTSNQIEERKGGSQ